jgi:GT2 family glycosyltransferase
MATRLLDLELSNGGSLPDVPLRYSRIRLLVQFHGIPLGFVDVENGRGALDPSELSATALRYLERQAWAASLARHLTVADGQGGERAPVTVVVAGTGAGRRLERCLTAISAQRHAADEVLVIDTTGLDGEAFAVSRRAGARLVEVDRRGHAAAWNRGLREARTPIVAFTDDRCLPDSGWLGSVLAGFSPGIDAVTGLVVPAELETRAQEVFEDGFAGLCMGFEPVLHSSHTGGIPYRPRYYGVGCNMAFRREALERLGGFDPAVEARGGALGAEADVLQRLIESGASVAYRPGAIVRRTHARANRALRRELHADARAEAAALAAAFGRAEGVERWRVASAYWDLIWRRHAAVLVRRAFRRGQPPRRCLLAGLLGGLVGPATYASSRVFRSFRSADPSESA